MHASAVVRAVRFGGDGPNLYVWIDADPPERPGIGDRGRDRGRVYGAPLRAGRGVCLVRYLAVR
jgi:hypothetical protein